LFSSAPDLSQRLKHHAPSVSYPLRRSFAQAIVYLCVWVSATALIVSWICFSRSQGLVLMLGFTAIALVAMVGSFGLRSSPVGQLVWDSQQWHWESAAYQSGVLQVEVLVIADFQHILLIRLENQAHASLWLWVERKAAPQRWLDLRRAIYSPHRTTIVRGVAA
jgi:hypothetical protein